MKKLVIITGLTASGKSGLAVKVAKKYNGEIISADSVQVYKGLDIGSAKVSEEEKDGIIHHLIDIKNYNESYNVGQFVSDCKNCIEEIVKKNKIPIIVGGTGLYIKALVSGYSLGEKSNEEFRLAMEDEALRFGNQYVWNKLNKLNPEKASKVHPNNLKRVIRYLELELNPTETKTESILKGFQVLTIGVIEDREIIYKRINQRVDEMILSGLEQEVRSLIQNGATADMQSMTAIGYKEWFDYFNGKTSKEKTIELIKQHSRNYCKRQLTFMKTIPNLIICNLHEAKERIKNFLK